MIELAFAIAVVLLVSAPITLAGRSFVGRPFGIGVWRGDPWPVGVQEQDIDHSWGADQAPAPVVVADGPPEASIEERASLEADEQPSIAVVRSSTRRAD